MAVQTLDQIAQDNYRESYKTLWLDACKLCVEIQRNQIASQRNEIEVKKVNILEKIVFKIR